MKSKFHSALAIALTCVTFTFGSAAVQAATITVDPLHAAVISGSTFNIKVVGQDFTDFAGGTIGGGFSLSWDPSILTLDAYSLTFPGDQTFGQLGVVDLTAGTLLNADVTSFNGTTLADFDIAVLTFTALNVGVSPTDVSIGLFSGGSERIWADSSGFNNTTPNFVDGTVTVNPVPVPAAVWLFGSGLLGLIGVARRRNAT